MLKRYRVIPASILLSTLLLNTGAQVHATTNNDILQSQ